MIRYEGLFFEEQEELLRSLEIEHLIKPIENIHITFKYKPSEEEIFDNLVGREFNILILGRGSDGENSGLIVKLPDELIPFYINETVPHITTSLNINAKTVNTKNILDFNKLEMFSTPIPIKGKFGYFIDQKVSYEKQKNKKN